VEFTWVTFTHYTNSLVVYFLSGKQAALASDYSILKFKHLAKLVLFHGRLNYKRTAVMSQFVIHR